MSLGVWGLPTGGRGWSVLLRQSDVRDVELVARDLHITLWHLVHAHGPANAANAKATAVPTATRAVQPSAQGSTVSLFRGN